MTNKTMSGEPKEDSDQEETPLQIIGRHYIEMLKSKENENLKIGNNIRIGFIFYGKNGEVTASHIESVKTDETK